MQKAMHYAKRTTSCQNTAFRGTFDFLVLELFSVVEGLKADTR